MLGHGSRYCAGSGGTPPPATSEATQQQVVVEETTTPDRSQATDPTSAQVGEQDESQAQNQANAQASERPAASVGDARQSEQSVQAETQAQADTLTVVAPTETTAAADSMAIEDVAAASESATASAATAAEAAPAESSYHNIYRLYNRYSGQHLYTSSWDEVKSTTSVGWYYESIAWEAPDDSEGNTEVYRLYNPYSGDHHYTTSAEERDNLVSLGWHSEGTAWYSLSEEDAVPLYRLFNPYATVGTHHYTTSASERDYLDSIGWNYEGEAWSGVNQPAKAVGAQWIGGKDSLFYVNDDGTTAKGMFTLGGKTYYAESNGHVLTSGGRYLDGKWYVANSDGSLTETTEATAKATNVLDGIGWNLKAAFNYSVMRHIDDEENGGQTSSHYFLKGVSQGQGNCYVMAGTFCTLARTLGYDAVQISGGVLSRRGTYNAHSWVEINGRVYDASYQGGTHRNGFDISKIGASGSGQWVYKNYRTMQP